MVWTRRGLIAAGAVFAATPALARAYPAEAALWEVRDGRAKVFLFGDSGPLRSPWRSARFEAALNESAVFWKETPAAGPGANALFMAKGIDPARPLSTWLTPSDRARVAAAAVSVGLAPVLLERLRPWLAAVFLDSSFRSHFGFKQENSPERAEPRRQGRWQAPPHRVSRRGGDRRLFRRLFESRGGWRAAPSRGRDRGRP